MSKKAMKEAYVDVAANEDAESRRRMETMHKLVEEKRVQEAMLREYLFPAAPLRIDILVPTRNRPDNVLEFCEGVYGTTADRPNVEMLFYIDQDDETTLNRIDDLTGWAEQHKDIHCRFHVGVRMGLAHVYEWMRQRVPGDVLMYTGDDIRFMTKGWDTMVRDAFVESGDRIMLLWGKDPSRDQPFPDNGFISRWGINCLKYMFPVFPPLNPEAGDQGISFTDIWLEAVYNCVGRKRYMPEMEFHHHHWRATGVSGTALETSRELKERPHLDTPYILTNIISKTWVTPEFEARQAEVPDHARNLLAWMDWYAEWCMANTTGYENTPWHQHYVGRKGQAEGQAEQAERMKEMEAAVKAGMARDHLGRVIVPDLRNAPWESSGLDQAKDDVADAIEAQVDEGPVEARPRPSRNKPCPCGSQKKYKHCCMVKEEVAA